MVVRAVERSGGQGFPLARDLSRTQFRQLYRGRPAGRHATGGGASAGHPGAGSSGVSNALANRATVLHYRGDHEAALRENERALACYEQSGSDRNVAITLRSMALIEIDLGRFDDAVARLERATASFSDLGLQMDRAMALNCLGEAHHRAGNYAAARRAHEQALVVSNDCGSRFEYARAQHGLGRVAKDQGRDTEAAGHWEEALKHYAALGAPEATQLAEDLTALQRTIIPPQRAGTPG
ncbi:tetratricopeptide repeat protein [Saccharopolyspora thermophila]|uniref:tetratricopeptide repeat protein n=1 Tax=Saccharopolyspora thermophila TaxID=89367 RepID=UPI00227B9134|nr:tetratricopeptide repeat protein [Saccharopolyspora subtropica]